MALSLSFTMVQTASSTTVPPEKLLPQLGHDFVGRLDAQVGLHKPRLEPPELGLVENLARFEDIADVGLQKLSGFLQPLLEFVKQSHRRMSLSAGRALCAENHTGQERARG